VDALHSPARFELSLDPPYYPPWETDTVHPLTLALASAYEAEAGRSPEWGYWGFGDMNLFAEEAGIPTVMIGPRGAGFHQANEYVEIPTIDATSRLLVRMACDLLGRE
jgi:acetylornithine deacetylase/succinyl-diaminopimelate desuccinylase-like protein